MFGIDCADGTGKGRVLQGLGMGNVLRMLVFQCGEGRESLPS